MSWVRSGELRPVGKFWGRGAVMVVLFMIPVLILAMIAVFPAWPYNRNWTYYPSGGLGAILALTVVLLLLNRI